LNDPKKKPQNPMAPDAVDPLRSTIRNADTGQLLLSALSGGDDMTFAGSVEAAARDLGPVYESLSLYGDNWMVSIVHNVRHRLRVLAEMHRREEAKRARGAS
jgi:hypothetical protein